MLSLKLVDQVDHPLVQPIHILDLLLDLRLSLLEPALGEILMRAGRFSLRALVIIIAQLIGL